MIVIINLLHQVCDISSRLLFENTFYLDDDTCFDTTSSEYDHETDESIRDEVDPLLCDLFEAEFDNSFLQTTRILEENYENKMNLIESNYKLIVGRVI